MTDGLGRRRQADADPSTDTGAFAWIGRRLATELVDLTDDVSCLDSEGFWTVVLPFEDAPVCARFARVVACPQHPTPVAPWRGPASDDWRTSLDRDGYGRAVDVIRAAIARGDVYQVNLTRRLSAPLPDGADLMALGAVLASANPAPHAATVVIPSAGVAVASASPELFLARRGRLVRSSPIKGTAATSGGFLAKDHAENVMIADLVRNDLGRVCDFGSVQVPSLCAVEEHPGLAHLVTTVEGRLRVDAGWPELLSASFPPGSVTGAPKIAAVQHLKRLEPVARGIYCGAIGWVDAETDEAELNVAIRTFWADGGELHFGTGGAITWDSEADQEWAETELKAARLLALASRPSSSSP